MEYLIQWFHTWVTHFGALVALLMTFSVYRDGLPEVEKLFKLFKSAILLAFIISIFSSHAHSHFMSHFLPLFLKK